METLTIKGSRELIEAFRQVAEQVGLKVAEEPEGPEPTVFNPSPGPWAVSKDIDGFFVDGSEKLFPEKRPLEVCKVHETGCYQGDAESNVNLILAGAEMFEAFEEYEKSRRPVDFRNRAKTIADKVRRLGYTRGGDK